MKSTPGMKYSPKQILVVCTCALVSSLTVRFIIGIDPTRDHNSNFTEPENKARRTPALYHTKTFLAPKPFSFAHLNQEQKVIHNKFLG